MINYTLIAYRPNCVDTCRGCYIGSTDSEMSVHCSTDSDEIIQIMSDLMYEQLARENKYEYSSYEFVLLFDGKTSYSDYSDDVDSYDMEGMFSTRAFQMANDKLVRIKHEQATKKATEKQKAEELTKERQEQQERETYERLKAKYE